MSNKSSLFEAEFSAIKRESDKKMEILESKLNVALKAMDDFSSQVVELKIRDDVLSQEVADQNAQHTKDLEKVENDHKKKTNFFIHKIDELESKNSLQEKKLQEYQKNAEKQNKEVEKLKEELSGCKEENKQLQESLHSTSEDFAQVNHQLSLVSDENCSLKAAAEELKCLLLTTEKEQ